MNDRHDLILKGIPASPGYAEGPVFDLDRPLASYAAKGSAEAEKAALTDALSRRPPSGWPA